MFFTPSLATKQHPQMSIANGEVTLSSPNYNSRFSFRQSIVLPLSAVKLHILPLKHDRFFYQIAWGNRELYCLLDFSECAKEIPMSFFGKMAWRAIPYLCFTASRYENGILAAFFKLIGQSNARLEDEVFLLQEEEQQTDRAEIVRTHTSGWAVAAMYAGLFSVLCIPAPIALVLGIIALRDCNRHFLKGTGRATFAIVMGALFSLLLTWFIFIELFIQ
jgi:hypothetical protein